MVNGNLAGMINARQSAPVDAYEAFYIGVIELLHSVHV